MDLAQLGKYLSKVKNIYTLLALSIVIVGAIIHLAVPIGDLRVIKVTAIIGINLILILLLPKIMRLIPKSQRTFVVICLFAFFYIAVASASVYVLGQMYESYAEETESSIPESAEAETTYETKEEKNFRATFIEKSQKQKNERPQIKEAATIISETNQIFHSAVINGIESSEHIPAFYVDERKGVTTFENITKQPICGGKVPRTITFHEEVTQLYTNQLNFNRDMNYGLINIFTWDRKICDIDFEMDIIHEGHTYIVKENKNYQVIKSTEGYTFNLNKQNYRQENNIYTLAFCDHSLNNCILRNFKIDIWEDSDNSFIDFKYEQANNISDLFNIEQIIENKSFWLVSKGSQNLGFVYFRGEHEMHLYIDERYNRTLFVKNKTKYDAALTIMSVLSCENVSYLDALKYSRSIEPLIWC